MADSQGEEELKTFLEKALPSQEAEEVEELTCSLVCWNVEIVSVTGVL